MSQPMERWPWAPRDRIGAPYGKPSGHRVFGTAGTGEPRPGTVPW